MTIRPFGPEIRQSTIAALLRVARGDRTGVALFGHTPNAFFASFVPLAALPTAVCVINLVHGEIAHAVKDLLTAVCVLLLPPIVSHAFAHRWQRDDSWMRFSVAYNWCQFALSALCMALLLAAGVVFGAAGEQPDNAAVVAAVAVLCLVLVGYGIWLHWFIARTGLGVSGGRAAFLVFATYAGSLLILIAHGLFPMDRG